MLKETHKCGFRNCIHGGQIKKNEKFKKAGDHYYHNDCYEIKQNLQYVENLWRENIKTNVSISYLRKTFNDYVFKDGIDSKYLAFVMEYVLDHNFKINYPQGLKYYFGYKEIKEKYEEKCHLKVKETIQKVLDDNAAKQKDEPDKNTTTYYKEMKNPFKELFGGA